MVKFMCLLSKLVEELPTKGGFVDSISYLFFHTVAAQQW